MSTPEPQKLPNVHPVVFAAINRLVDLVNEAPLSAPRREQLQRDLQNVSAYAVNLEEQITGLKSQIEAITPKEAPAKPE